MRRETPLQQCCIARRAELHSCQAEADPHLMGLTMMGPLASSISKGMPSAGSGVRMSLQCHNIDVLCSVFGTPRRSWRVVCTTQQRVCYDKGRLVGVPRHLNRMTPSGLKDSQGCKLISQMRSVVSDRSRNDG